jgi:glucose/arabinose dehydrogenase
MPGRVLPFVLGLLITIAAPAQPVLQPHTLRGADGRSLTLSLPAEFNIVLALSGLHRVRFFAQAPDGRLFVTDMYDRTDNHRGTVYILDGWDPARHTFARAIPYLQRLRNPNNLAFYTDGDGQSWLYLPLTDRLLRFRYHAGDNAPSSAPQVLARYPAYGLDYKYGGWHLTRTVAVGKLRSSSGQIEDKLFVSVGSSCNACQEKEPIRATLSVMNPDGSDQHIVAQNLRNAVGLAWSAADTTLYATNMGDDQLGDRAPDDPFLAIRATQLEQALATSTPLDYGWPYCYYAGAAAHPDPHFGTLPQAHCDGVPAAYTSFAAHSSPLGVAHFPASDPLLGNSFLVALHGAGHPRIGAGYKLVRFTAADRTPQDFLTGFFLREAGQPRVLGRPCGIFRIAPDTFLLTDDVAGRIYAIYPAPSHRAV